MEDFYGETEEIKKKRIAIILQILAGGFWVLGGYLLVNKLLFGDWNFARLILFLIF